MMDSDGSNFRENSLDISKESKRLENSEYSAKQGEDYIFSVWQDSMEKVLSCFKLRNSEKQLIFKT